MTATPKNPLKGADQNKTIALFLCLFLAYLYKEFVWDPYFSPLVRDGQGVSAVTQAPPRAMPPEDQFSEPKSASEFSETPAGATPTRGAVVAAQPSTDVAALAASGKYPADAQLRENGSVELETAKFRASLSLLGGRMTGLYLKDYAAHLAKDSPRLNVVDHVEHAPYPLGAYSGGLNDAWVQYELVSSQKLTQNGVLSLNSVNSSSAVVLKGQLPDGREITKTVTFHPDGYFIDVDVILSQPPADSSRLSVEWTRLVGKDSPTLLDPYEGSGYVWFDGQKALREPFNKLPAEQQDLSNIVWVALSDKYFTSTLLSEDGPVTAKVMKTGELYRARLAGSTQEKHLRLFAGPKSYRLLEQAGSELKRNVDLGWTGVISAPLMSMLHLVHDLVGNYGLAIVLLTILVKFALYPLTASSFKQMKALQDLSPELKRIREAVTDRQQQQLETMKLYKEKGVNPLGGCLPMFVQMPVFIGLYSALMLDIELRHAIFGLWIHDLSAPEKLMVGGVGIPVMVLLFVASMLVQQWTTPSTMDPAQKKAMLVVPLVFGFMFATMPAGLTLYWLTNNLISIGQQIGLRKEGGRLHAFRLTFLIALSVFILAFIITRLG